MTSQTQPSGLFLTSAKSIQRYVLATDPLKDMLGGSAIVRQLPEQLLPAAISKLRDAGTITGKPEKKIVATAGRAAYFFPQKTDALALAKVWPLLAARFAPGLEVVQSVMECRYEEIPKVMLNQGESSLRSGRQCIPVTLPEPGPLVIRNRTTGLAAANRTDDFPDHILVRKNESLNTRAYKDLMRPLLPEKFAREINFSEEHFPLAFDQIAAHDHSYLAVIHIDANSLGTRQKALLESAPVEGECLVQRLQSFYQSIECCIITALQRAVCPIMEREQENSDSVLYPFRPIICSGDDITMVMRAADGIGFARRFLREFSEISMENREALGLEAGEYLTACAGIAFVKKAFPFAIAYDLCESLCTYAKDATKRKKSALAFHRVSASNTASYPQVIRDELTVAGRIITMNPYLVYPAEEIDPTSKDYLPRLNDLLDLAKTMNSLPATSLRDILQQMYDRPDRVKPLFDRMCAMAGNGEENRRKKRIVAQLEKITGTLDDRRLWWLGKTKHTPFADAGELLAMKAIEPAETAAADQEEYHEKN